MSDEDLKSYIKSYYLDRKMTYTKLDKHDRAIGVLLNENKQLKEERPYLYTNTEWEDILEYQGKSYIELDRFKTIQQENKQLKEELENIKDFNNKLQASKDRLDKDDYNLAHILIELEEYLKQEIENIKNNYSQINGNYFNMNYVIETYEIVLDKIQELKERYK